MIYGVKKVYIDEPVNKYMIVAPLECWVGDRPQQLMQYNSVYWRRRKRKILSRNLLNHLLMQYGHCLEGYSQPVPKWYAEQWKGGRINAAFASLHTRLSGMEDGGKDIPKCTVHYYSYNVYYRRKRKMVSDEIIPYMATVFGGRLR